MTVIDPLFFPFECKSLKLTPRFLMAPMSRYFSPGGVVTDAVADYYRRRIEGGAAGGGARELAQGVSGDGGVDALARLQGDVVPHLKGRGGRRRGGRKRK